MTTNTESNEDKTMNTNTETTETVVTYTTAEEAYDGFGTRTIAVVAKDNRGRPIRQVETPARHVEWQRMRYASGLHMVQDEAEFAKCVEHKLVTLIEINEPKDNAAVQAVADALEQLEEEARKAIELRDRMREAIKEEKVDGLVWVSSNVRSRLAHFSGWSKEIFPGAAD